MKKIENAYIKAVFITKKESSYKKEDGTVVNSEKLHFAAEDANGDGSPIEIKRGEKDKTIYQKYQKYEIAITITQWKENLYATSQGGTLVKEKPANVA